MYRNLQDAVAAWQSHSPMFAERGAVLPDVRAYVPDAFKRDYRLAMDAQPALTTTPNSAVPAFLTTLIDPEVFKILFAPNRAAIIFNERKKGSWLDETAMFPTVEHLAEVSSYGDFAENGRTGVNTNWPQRQAYLFQTMKEYGERELERAGLARINWVSEIDQAAATGLNKFSNLSYFFGIGGLQNYGLLNDPNLNAALTPATKGSTGGVKWVIGVTTANEIYADLQAIFIQLVAQTTGLVEASDKLVLAMSPTSEVFLTTTNSFSVNVFDLLKKNFPNIRFETAVQYGAATAANPQGVAAGNLVQMIAETVEGQNVGYCAFNEKMRAHKIIPAASSFKQKVTAGTWGSIIRQPFAIASMVGV